MMSAKPYFAILLALLIGGAPGFAAGIGARPAGAEAVDPVNPESEEKLEPAIGDPVKSRAQNLDQLYQRLAASSDEAETRALVGQIDQLLLQTDSPAAELLMNRALTAMNDQNQEVAGQVLDKLIELQPRWAEAWNKRATLRFILGDNAGSMADIAQTLKLEPRHIGAISGLGLILERSGLREESLRAFENTLVIAPQLTSAKEAIARLKAAIAGQAL